LPDGCPSRGAATAPGIFPKKPYRIKLDSKAALLADAEKRNFTRWPILDTYVWPNSEVAGSYQGEVDFFRNWMVARIAWLDANL
jgi:hypothetical protein